MDLRISVRVCELILWANNRDVGDVKVVKSNNNGVLVRYCFRCII